MLRNTAQIALDSLAGRPSFTEDRYALEDKAELLGTTALGHLRQLAAADPSAEVASSLTRKNQILSDYGFSDAPINDKEFAFADGVAIIPVHGLLINRFAYSWGFVTGYNFIRTQFDAAQEDDDVKLIVFDVNSYGGSAAGCQELSQAIYDGRAVKPSVAIVDFNCYSAAYFVGSAATRVVVTPSSGVGSIGCILTRMDVTGALDNVGVKMTPIFAGKNKTDFNPYVSMTAAEKARLQASVDSCYDTFVAAVARNRNLSNEAIRGTEASCYNAPDALGLQLIDSIQPPAVALEEALEFFFPSDDPDNNEDDIDMNKTPAQIAAEATTAAAAAPPAVVVPPVVAPAAATAPDVASQVQAALKADRERTRSILALPEAKDRPKLAASIAADTELSADAAKVILANAAVETAPQGNTRSPLDAAMGNTTQPNVTGTETGAGTGEEAGTPEAKAAANTARILSAQSRATGIQHGKAA